MTNLSGKTSCPDFGPEFFQNKIKEGYIKVSYGMGVRVKNVQIYALLALYHQQGKILTQEYIQQFPSETSDIPSCSYEINCEYPDQKKLSEHLNFFKIKEGQIIDLRTVDWKTYKQ